jgi:hypothetical protein
MGKEQQKLFSTAEKTTNPLQRKEYSLELRYKQIGDQFYPELELPEQTDYEIGKYGKLHLAFLKNHRRGTYTTLLTEGRLNEHLHTIDEKAAALMETEVKKLAARNGITEELKATDQMRWVQEMNNVRACAEEFVLREVIYR